MSRTTLAVDRIIAVLLAIVLIPGGAALAVWGTRRVAVLDGEADLSQLSHAADQTWWPWAVGAIGAALVLLGLRWLLGHLPRRGMGPVRLPGTDRSGRLSADAGPVVSAAAQVLQAEPGVRSARGSVLRDRGQAVARIIATIDPSADLREISSAADRVSAELRTMLGRDDIRCRVQLRVGHRRGRPVPRVQ